MVGASVVHKLARGWPAISNDEEARAYLQGRLRLLSALMFGSFVILLSLMVLLYWVYPEIEPKRNHLIYAVSVVGVGILVVIWRGLLVRKPCSMSLLNAIDLFYGVGTGSVLGAAGYLAQDLKPSQYICLLYSGFMVLLRANLIPSTATRTLVTGSLTCLPMVIAATAASFQTQQDVPPPAYIGGALMISLVLLLLATIGSRVIYGLRLQVSEAKQLGQYTLDRKIGEGGMGEVYRARHALLRRPTAIKLIRPDHVDAETLDRFEGEVQHMSQLKHPNTAVVFDYGRSSDGVFYYAMEYLDGIDLDKLVANYGPQPPERVAAILIQVCGALDEAHRAGIVHRDIKPANIILCDRGGALDHAKVVDFGLAKEVTTASGNTNRITMGTPAYMAPELATDPEKVGPVSDLYALGAVGYYLLTGKHVFEGETAVELIVKHASETPVPPSRRIDKPIPTDLEEIILACLAKSPVHRPATAAVLRDLLRAIPAGHGWPESDAARWWNDFRTAAVAKESSATPTLTITVNFDERR
jgi:hypothetical protein